MEDMIAPQKWSLQTLIAPLVSCWSVGHEYQLLHVNEWDMSQTKKLKDMSGKFTP